MTNEGTTMRELREREADVRQRETSIVQREAEVSRRELEVSRREREAAPAVVPEEVKESRVEEMMMQMQERLDCLAMRGRRPAKAMRSAHDARSSREERALTFDFSRFNHAECEMLQAFVAVADSATARTITYNGIMCEVESGPGKPFMVYEKLPGELMPWGNNPAYLIPSNGKFHVPVRLDIFRCLTRTPQAEWAATKAMRTPMSPYFA